MRNFDFALFVRSRNGVKAANRSVYRARPAVGCFGLNALRLNHRVAHGSIVRVDYNPADDALGICDGLPRVEHRRGCSIRRVYLLDERRAVSIVHHHQFEQQIRAEARDGELAVRTRQLALSAAAVTAWAAWA